MLVISTLRELTGEYGEILQLYAFDASMPLTVSQRTYLQLRGHVYSRVDIQLCDFDASKPP